jgi:hypothetical protein
MPVVSALMVPQVWALPLVQVSLVSPLVPNALPVAPQPLAKAPE